MNRAREESMVENNRYLAGFTLGGLFPPVKWLRVSRVSPIRSLARIISSRWLVL